MKRLVRAFLIVITIGAFVIACVFGLLVRELTQPAGASNVAQEFVIEQGDTVALISNNLASAGLIEHAILFRALANVRDQSSAIQPGIYNLSPSMAMNQILAEITKPPVPTDELPPTASLVIPEGLRLEEIAAIVEATGAVSADDFLAVARDGEAYRADYAFLSDLPSGASLEGFLFPNTYEIYTNATADDIVRKLLDTFEEQWSGVTPSAAVEGRSVFEIVTMASIIQREASNNEEMPRVSAAFWNRLKPEFAGQQLGADPTVQYALGYSEEEQRWWRRELTVTDLAINSPYNTRINAGLPPGPISAPGLAALEAAANPADEDITYFVAQCVPEGERPAHNFTNDYTEFLRFQEEYLTCEK